MGMIVSYLNIVWYLWIVFHKLLTKPKSVKSCIFSIFALLFLTLNNYNIGTQCTLIVSACSSLSIDEVLFSVQINENLNWNVD